MHVYNQKTDIKPNNLKVFEFGGKLIKEPEEDSKNQLRLTMQEGD
jgi:hypothetical protein